MWHFETKIALFVKPFDLLTGSPSECIMLNWTGLAFVLPAWLYRPPEESPHHWRHQRHTGKGSLRNSYWSAFQVQDTSFHPFSHASQADFYNKGNRGTANRTGTSSRSDWRQEGGRGGSLDERTTTLGERGGTLDGSLGAMESRGRAGRVRSGGDQQTSWPAKQETWGGGQPVQVWP